MIIYHFYYYEPVCRYIVIPGNNICRNITSWTLLRRAKAVNHACFSSCLSILLATAFSWYKYISLKGVPGADEGIGFSRKISYYTGNRKTWLILGCLASVALSILILVIICLRERVQIATALIKEAAKFVLFSVRYVLTYTFLPHNYLMT